MQLLMYLWWKWWKFPAAALLPSKQTVLTGKFGKKIKYQHVGVTTIQKMKAIQKCIDKTEKIAKVFCFSIIHQGATNYLSNASVIVMYETAYHGILDHHSVMKVCMKEFSDKTLAPSPQYTLNKSNIHLYGKAIVEAYKVVLLFQLVIFKVKKFHLLGFDAWWHDQI